MKKLIKKDVKMQNGITLIALVITIIVLLILAGISLNLLIGDNSVVKKAGDAKIKTQEAEITEKIKLAEAASKMNENVKADYNYLKQALASEFGTQGTDWDISNEEENPWVVTVGSINYSIENTNSQASKLTDPEKEALRQNGIEEIDISTVANLNLKNNSRIKAVLSGEVPLTTEMTYIQGTIDTGIVVSINGNEFVWVPVPNVVWDKTTAITSNSYTPMAVLKEGSTADYVGLLYDFTNGAATYNSSYTIGTSSYREPATISSDSQNNITEEVLKNEYREVVNSINKYKGFYVGRYELGLEGTDQIPVIKNANENPNIKTVNTSYVNGLYLKWYGLYDILENMYNDSDLNIKSTMLWGSQYDAMLNWLLKTGTNVSVKNSNLINRTQVTGSKTTDVINNIFDLYGCHGELTIESYGSNYRTYRGFCHDRVDDVPATRHTIISATSGDDSEGGRCALYIK